MPKSTTSKRVTSAEAKSEIIEAANHELPLPLPDLISLSKKEMLIYERICNEFARIELTDHTVDLIAMLAKAMHELEVQQDQLANEDVVDTGARGGLVMNPRATYVSKLRGDIINMRRSLGIHAPSKGKRGNREKTRDHMKETEASAIAAQKDERKKKLLPRPKSVN